MGVGETKQSEKIEKPIILFVGNAGVGKSSCIKVICNITDKADLEKLNITDQGVIGTRESNVYDTPYTTAIDVRGKIQEQNVDEYVEYLLKDLEKYGQVHFIVGVVNAFEDRDDDIDALVLSLTAISKELEKPFIVLMNKLDRAEILGKLEQYRRRKKYLKEKGAEVQSTFSWSTTGHKTFYRGVFPTAANPHRELKPECTKYGSQTACSQPDDESDEFPVMNTRFLIRKLCRYCMQCNTITIFSSELTEKEKIKITKYAEDQKARFIDAPTSEGLNPRDPAFQAIISSTNDIIGASLIKSACIEISDRIAGTTKIIRSGVESIFGLSDAIECDKKLCESIGNLFEFENTALISVKYENNRWNEVKIMDKVVRFLRITFGSPDKALPQYVAAWGIYYARKFRDVAFLITENYGKDRKILVQAKSVQKPNEHSAISVYELISDRCMKVYVEHNDAKQLEYYYFILEHGLEAALYKYILETETTASNVTHKEPYKSPELGKN